MKPFAVLHGTLLSSIVVSAGCAAAPSALDTHRTISETEPVEPATSGDAQPLPPDAGMPDALSDAGIDADAALDAHIEPAQVEPASAPAPARRSSGCGKAADGAGRFVTRTRNVADRDRTYHIRLPEGYDPSRAYPVVFRWHGRGGDGLAGGLEIERAAGREIIIAAANGLDATWAPATEEADLALFDAMLEELSRDACVDPARIFAYGFSAGGGFTNLLGCRRASVLHAIAAIAGFDRTDSRCDGVPMPAWLMHDRDDPAVSITFGRAARDRSLRRNACTSEGDVRGDCTFYRGCRAGQPVVWCETGERGHDIRGDVAPQQVWEFFSGLP